jgi:bacteriocin leader peptide (microcyclamide/patellamide family)
MPQAAQPVNRFTTGQLPAELAELSEEALQVHCVESGSMVYASDWSGLCECACICPCLNGWTCSYDGDDAE